MTNKYYEFNNHEYYSLVTTTGDINSAIQLYQYFIAGESIAEVKEEGLPVEISQELAFEKFLRSYYKEEDNGTLDKAKEEFNSLKNVPILTDSSLL